jgi:hypothetical protein
VADSGHQEPAEEPDIHFGRAMHQQLGHRLARAPGRKERK